MSTSSFCSVNEVEDVVRPSRRLTGAYSGVGREYQRVIEKSEDQVQSPPLCRSLPQKIGTYLEPSRGGGVGPPLPMCQPERVGTDRRGGDRHSFPFLYRGVPVLNK